LRCPALGFDRAEVEFTADALELLANVDGPGLEVVKQHMRGVVVAVRAHGGAQPRVVLVMVTGAGQIVAALATPLMGVTARTACALAPTSAGAGGGHRPEAWCRECGEHARMRAYGFGDALAAGQPGPDDLPRVAPVQLRAGPADLLATVAAWDTKDAARLGGGVIKTGSLAGDAIDSIDAAMQAHWVSAVTSCGKLLLPAREIVP
jgi:hypothetical protein